MAMTKRNYLMGTASLYGLTANVTVQWMRGSGGTPFMYLGLSRAPKLANTLFLMMTP